MENFKRKTPTQQRKNSSIDGFVGSKQRRGVSHEAYDRNRTLSPGRREIGQFNRPDGFYGAKPKEDRSATQNVGRRSRARTEQPQPVEEKPKRMRRFLKDKHAMKKALNTFLIVFLIGGGYLFGRGYLSLLNIFKGGGGAAALQQDVDPSLLKGEGDGRVNILLLGRGGEGHEGANLTDTIIVASIDPVNKKAALLGIPRDLYVLPEGYWGMKINSVFSAGRDQAPEGTNPDEEGMKLLEETLEETIGIPMHYRVLVDFEAFKQAVDTVGGVEIDVPEELAVYDYMHYGGSPYVLNVGEGRQQFDGLKALMFSRTRKTSPRGDFDRSERQRLVMVALKDKVLSLGTFGNPFKINELVGNLGSHVTSNLTTEEVLRLYEIAGEIPSSEIASVGLADEDKNLVTTGNIGGLSVVVPTAGLYNFDEIKNFVRNELRDGFLQNEDATVAVYNGTDVAGLAGRTADELKSFGYKVSTVADAPLKGQVTTTLVDLTNGEKKYTKAYLEKRFGVTATNRMPTNAIDPGTADFVIILGTNEESRLEN